MIYCLASSLFIKKQSFCLENLPAAAIIITVRAFVRLPSGGCPCFSRCGRPPLFLPVPFCMPFYIILSAAVLGGLLCSFSLLLEIIRIRLIRIYARFGAGSGSHFWVVPPFLSADLFQSVLFCL